MIEIRQETPADYSTVYEINHLAFGQENESRLIKKIRQGDTFIPELSLVAEAEMEKSSVIFFFPK